MTSTDNERLTIEEIIKIASEAAVEKYKQMEADKCEQEREKARKNTKRLLKGYKELKEHCEHAVASVENISMPCWQYIKLNASIGRCHILRF